MISKMGYKAPKQPLVKGLCCLCGNPCGDGHYLHWECALAYSATKDKAIEESREMVKEQDKTNPEANVKVCGGNKQ